MSLHRNPLEILCCTLNTSLGASPSQRFSLHSCFSQLLTYALSLYFSEGFFNLNPNPSCISEVYNLIMCFGRKHFLWFLILLSDHCIRSPFVLCLEAGCSCKFDFNGLQTEVSHADSITTCYRWLQVLNAPEFLQFLKCIYFQAGNGSTARHWQCHSNPKVHGTLHQAAIVWSGIWCRNPIIFNNLLFTYILATKITMRN